MKLVYKDVIVSMSSLKIALLLLLLAPWLAFAQQTVVVTNNQQLYLVENNIRYLPDSSGSLSFNYLKSLPDSVFKFQQKSGMSFGNSHYAWWFKIYVENKTAEEVYLLFRNHEIQHLDIYILDSAGKTDSVHSGITMPFTQRFFKTNTPGFALGSKPAVVFLRIKTPILYLPIKIGAVKPVVAEMHKVDVFNIFIIGLMLALSVYNLVIFVFTKDKVHMYYFAYIFSSVYLIAHARGYVQEFLPSIAAVLATHGNFLGSLIAIFSILFTTAYLNTRKRAPFFHKWLLLIVITNLLLLLTELLPYKGWYNDAFQLLHLTLMPAMLGAGVYTYVKGYKPALYYLLAFGVMKTGVTLGLCGYMGWLSYNNFFIQNAYYIGAAMEALILSLAIAYRFNVYKKEAYEKELQLLKERNRITADLHDDIGATLSSMNIYGELAGQVWEDKPAKSKELIDKISVSSKELMGRMGDIIWSMKPADEEKYTLEGRLKNYSNELLAPKDIVCTFDIDNKLAASIKDPEIRKNILLICKEAINNIAKYSGARQVQLLFQQKENEILLSISDDGVGFDAKTAKNGNGISNITNRCSLLQGRFNLQTAPQQGVVITCHFPVAIISHSRM